MSLITKLKSPSAYNPMLCLASKNKKETAIQCPKKKKSGSDYCGIHIRAKKVTHIDQSLKIIISVDKGKVPKKRRVDTKLKKEYFTLAEMAAPTASIISSLDLKKSITKLGLHEYINLYQPIENILLNIKDLHLLYVMVSNNLDKIIKLQAFIRMRLTHNRYKCVNKEDFLTFEELLDIHSPHFFHYWSPDTKRFYGFNVQTFHQLVTKSKDPQNPYTRGQIPPPEILRVNKIAEFMKTRGYETAEEMLELTEEQKFNNRVLEVFCKLDDLGNYTNSDWFTKLSLDNLKEFYTKGEDMWSYRLQMSQSVKEQIVDDGLAFVIPTTTIKNMLETEKRKLQNIILNEIDKLITQGHSDDDKRTGAMIVLTTFTEVVPEAATAMPHYVQSGWSEE